ncbi:hypothetical protein FJR05_20810 [Dolichospermum sp. UHCC 0259]|nr:hypothetical protein [Dolichospermum sp. UHCC 0259]
MYFLENYSPIETYNYVHSTIKYEHQSSLSQFVVPNDINGYLPIKISPASINQIDSIPKENLTDSDFLVSKTDLAQNVPEVGKNNLQTEPTTPEQKPFKPQKLPLILEKPLSPAASPSITMLTPSAYGKSWGRASIGLGFQSRARFTNKADGVSGVGFGLGNAKESVGLDINIGIVDLSNFQDGNISFKVHTQLKNDIAVAVGVKNFITFGSTDGGTSGYGVISKMFRLQDSEKKPFSRIYLSAGMGGGQFRSEFDINNNIDSVGVFGSVAVKVVQPVNTIIEWSGQDLGLGLSVTPLKQVPLVITPAITDITGNAGDGIRFILGVGYSFSF